MDQHTAEGNAVRLALGARASAILSWAGSHVSRLAGWGIALGALAGWGASRWLKGMVFGISAENPEMILIPAAAVISIAALAASLLLWRATQIDPVSNLHSD